MRPRSTFFLFFYPSLIDKDRKAHYEKIYKNYHENGDVSATYKTAKTQVGWKSVSSPVSFLMDGRRVSAPQEMAELQAKTFHNKTMKLINELPQPVVDPLSALQESMKKWGTKKDSRELFTFKPLSNMEIINIVGKLRNNTSSTHNNMDTIIIKHGIQILHKPIAHIVNLSIKNCKFAARWKVGKLLPLHKGKGLSLRDPTSYRPISLLPIIGKLVERALQPQVLDFMSKSGQLNQNHHSYRKQHSTVTAMLQISDTMFEGSNWNKITTAVMLDQSSVFDVLKHELLLEKLHLYNFSNKVIEWTRSYLSYRSNYITIGTKNSKYRNVEHGVPQGSVLGLILYVIYINKLPEVINNDDHCPDEVHRSRENLFTENCKLTDIKHIV